MQTGKI